MAVAARAPAIEAPERAVRAPAPQRAVAGRARRAARRPRLGRGVVWIVTVAVLLAGIVALNVAVLRLHLRSGDVADDVAKIRTQNAELQAELSTATAVGRIDSLGRMRYGLVDAGALTYVRLPPPDRRAR